MMRTEKYFIKTLIITKMDKINLKIEGDHESGFFSMFLIEIERNNISIPIFLTSEQTNLGLEDPEEQKLRD